MYGLEILQELIYAHHFGVYITFGECVCVSFQLTWWPNDKHFFKKNASQFSKDDNFTIYISSKFNLNLKNYLKSETGMVGC